ncbi:Rieske 2Fe-2S domain-containing protein [Roseisalinus antarcticus]|uniref:Phthalate 4,5-dioxygenase oxygenase subunit n=1 Tax=Roseisalinus antarcticus TaxID=254357 RepID=A0A1Y5TB63_9RHOB|nr:Rieske 2Fe-2S domain-containing protein [Roseisalinus antarcticus]SLN56400.1 Phthalate 4,5-dioxygenase oxygenase subunit [Roseisalinus antarcticus]
MITAEENVDLCRVGRGTLMGEFFRQFWTPVCLSSELVADGDPVRLMILGEKLIGFRDSDGRVGVMDHRCPHRCASLFFGRNELGGIRCAYHGWKFDVNGKCLDQPNLEDKNKYPAGTPAYAYKTCESGGLVFAYFGERQDAPPPLPEIEAIMGEGNDANIALTHRDCNYMQALEGDVDTSHLGFLHAGGIDGDRLDLSDPEVFTVTEKSPKINVTTTDFGTMYSAQRDAYEGQEHQRYACYLFPFWVTYPGGGGLEVSKTVNAWVPIDDHSTMIFNIDLSRAEGGGKKSLKYTDGTPVSGLARPLEYLPTTTDWKGRWRPVKDETNDYGIDREWQRNGDSYTGIVGVPLQDQAIQESMGPVVDRTMEHLAASDRMVILTRRVMLDAAIEWRDEKKLPDFVDHPEYAREARGGDILVPKGTDWLEFYEEKMAAIKAGKQKQSAAE